MNEESRWEGARPDAEIHTLARAGDLEGLEGLSQGIGLDIIPYGLLGVNRDIARPDRVKPVRDAGADIFYRITSNLLSSTTINTDFAETEVDTRQVNLTRFPTLFPEKRDFFLEDAGVFQFGLQANSSSLIPFFSRRIGLVGGRTAPILLGEKLTGNVGRLLLGILDVKTRDSDVAPGQNFAIARAKYGFWKQSYIGGLFTHGEPTGNTDNSLAGADLSLATSNFLGGGNNFDLVDVRRQDQHAGHQEPRFRLRRSGAVSERSGEPGLQLAGDRRELQSAVGLCPPPRSAHQFADQPGWVRGRRYGICAR